MTHAIGFTHVQLEILGQARAGQVWLTDRGDYSLRGGRRVAKAAVEKLWRLELIDFRSLPSGAVVAIATTDGNMLHDLLRPRVPDVKAPRRIVRPRSASETSSVNGASP